MSSIESAFLNFFCDPVSDIAIKLAHEHELGRLSRYGICEKGDMALLGNGLLLYEVNEKITDFSLSLARTPFSLGIRFYDLSNLPEQIKKARKQSLKYIYVDDLAATPDVIEDLAKDFGTSQMMFWTGIHQGEPWFAI